MHPNLSSTPRSPNAGVPHIPAPVLAQDKRGRPIYLDISAAFIGSAGCGKSTAALAAASRFRDVGGSVLYLDTYGDLGVRQFWEERSAPEDGVILDVSNARVEDIFPLWSKPFHAYLDLGASFRLRAPAEKGSPVFTFLHDLADVLVRSRELDVQGRGPILVVIDDLPETLLECFSHFIYLCRKSAARPLFTMSEHEWFSAPTEVARLNVSDIFFCGSGFLERENVDSMCGSGAAKKLESLRRGEALYKTESGFESVSLLRSVSG